ncbi:MAG: hypothetical protein ACLPUO_01635 [Streptosporangiaceae bacterium]|jgi:hypothetical protein
MNQPDNRDANPATEARPARQAGTTWAREQLRDRIQRSATALAEALQAADPQNRPPEAELEAEP